MTSRVPASTRFPRLDLPRFNVMRMFITTECDWARDNQEILHSLLDDRGLFVSGTPYTVKGKKHLITARIDRVDAETTRAEIYISYDATDYPDRVSIPRTDRREREFLTHALRLTGIDAFLCNIEFLFADAEDSALWFPLPSQIGGTSDASGTFLIVGVNAVKLPEESSEDMGYGFTLSRDPTGEVFLDLHCPLVRKFTPNLPRHALAEGRAIASRLVQARPARKRSTE